MLALRIIPCLDVAGRVVVKGRKFQNLRPVGDAVYLAAKYYQQGADELVFLDVMATVEERQPFFELIRDVAREVFVPLTVGGGICNLFQVERLLQSGADKVSVGSYALKDPLFLKAIAANFGSQCLVVSVDARRIDNSWRVFINGGREDSGVDVFYWVKKVEELGAGEILLNSIDADGEQAGYDLELIERVNSSLSLPLIASGGAGSLQHIIDLLSRVNVEAVLVASLVHLQKISIIEIKEFLKQKGVEVRC